MKYIFNFICGAIVIIFILSIVVIIGILQILYLIWNFEITENKLLEKLFRLIATIMALPLKQNSIKYIHDKIIDNF